MHDLLRPESVAPCSTLSVIVMDASTSMRRFGSTPVDSLHEYVRDLAAGPTAASIAAGVVTFSSEPRVCVPVTPVRAFPRPIDYVTSAGTRLYGATRDVLRALLASEAPQVPNVIVAVFTDGEDNASSERTRIQLVELAGVAQRRGFTLLTFGIGVDGRRIAERMGFPFEREAARSAEATSESIVESVRATTRITLLRSLPPPRPRS